MYSEQFISHLAQAVRDADRAIPLGLSAVTRITQPFLDVTRKQTFTTQIEQLDPLGPESPQALVAVGLIGLLRTIHVTANNELGGHPTDDQKFSRAWNHIEELEQLYYQIDLTRLLPKSIHGGSIAFPIEVTQDFVSTYQKVQDYQQSSVWLNELPFALFQASKLRRLANTVGPHEALRQKNYEGYLHRRRYIGTLSAVSVLQMRAGLQADEENQVAYFSDALHSQLELQRRLQQMQLATDEYEGERNKGRLTTVVKRALQGALFGYGKNQDRLKIFVQVAQLLPYLR